MLTFHKIVFFLFIFIILLILSAWLALQYLLYGIADGLDPEQSYGVQHELYWEEWEHYLGVLEEAGLSPRETMSNRMIPREDGSGFHSVGYGQSKPLQFKPPQRKDQSETARKALAHRQSVAQKVKKRVLKIANAQDPIDKVKARQAIHALYKAMGQTPPKKIDFYHSGYDVTILYDEKRYGEDGDFGSSVEEYMEKNATTPLKNPKALWGKYDWKRNAHLFAPDFEWLASYKHVSWENEARVTQIIADAQKEDPMQIFLKGELLGGSDDLNALTMFWYTNQIGIKGEGKGENFSKKEQKFMALLADVIRQTGYVYLYPNWALVMGRPLKIDLDEKGKLHNASGSALIWDKEKPQYFLHGEEVPPKLILNPKSLTLRDLFLKDEYSWDSQEMILSHISVDTISLQDILELGSALKHWKELRDPNHYQLTRVREKIIEYIGEPRFIKMSHARLVDKTSKGNLWRYDFKRPKIFDDHHVGDHVWQVLEQRDPKTKKQTFLKIREDITTVEKAISHLEDDEAE